jgi:DNA-binding helix-hairpin-helix protein with protein kinase domain
MEVTLTNGTKVRCEDKPFNQGAEGEIYWAEGKTHVIKLYFGADPLTQQRRQQTIHNIIDKFNLVKEDPSRQAFFGWPDAMVTTVIAGQQRLGIRMPAVKDALPLERYVRAKFWQTLPPTERGSWHTRVSIAYRMARIMRWMHLRGLCHSDLSPKNFLVNINSGQTTLIDCDGLVVPGVQPPGVLGTPQMMAPELVMGKTLPTVNSDKHALAVLIYWTFLLRHPLQGPKTHDPDPEKDEQLAYGAKALYIEHPTDHSNQPGRLPFTSALLTPAVRSLFNKAFVLGLHDPLKRPSAAEWEAALVRLADQLVPCANPACPMKAFVVLDTHGIKCPWCATPVNYARELPLLLLYRTGMKKGSYVSDDWQIAGYPNRRLSLHHADTNKQPAPGVPAPAVAHFEMDSVGRWVLVNDELDDAHVLETVGASPLKRGSRVELKPGLRILMGRTDNYRVGYVRMVRTA